MSVFFIRSDRPVASKTCQNYLRKSQTSHNSVCHYEENICLKKEAFLLQRVENDWVQLDKSST